MPNINFELNLNKHPKDVPNRALVSAHNVQVSGDLSCLQSEFCIKENDGLKDIIDDNYIAGYIPCNKEFILFIAPKDWSTQLTQNSSGIAIDVWRFREQGELKENGKWKDIKHRSSFDLSEGKKIYNNFIWNGGKLKGTFTYNIKNQLILAIAESDTLTGQSIPLKTINVGLWDDINYDKEQDIITIINNDNDLNLTNDKLSLSPEIIIPSIKDYNYINGLSYKGWYYFFIRYKINNVDYSKWFSLGYPILINEIEKYSLFDYNINKETDDKNSNNEYIRRGYCNIQTEISSGSNTCNTTIELTIDNLSTSFKTYQIGFICTTNDSHRAFKTLDIDINSTTFYLDYSSLEEYNVNDLTFEHYNYYNVKNTINYKNRLYISNYKESNFDYNELKEFAKNIELKCIKNTDDNFADRCLPIEKSGGIIDFNTLNIIFHPGRNSPTISKEDIISGRTINCGRQEWHFGGANFQNPETWNDKLYIINENKQINYTTIQISNKNAATEQNPQFVKAQFVIGNTQFDITVKCVYSIDYGNVTYYFPESANGDIVETQIIVDNYVELPIEEYIERFDSRNVISSFKNRLKDRTLIPGGYYKFYIHFINKYGEFSDGILITRDIDTDTNIGSDGFSNISNYSQQTLDDNSLFVIPKDIVTNVATGQYYTSYSLNKYYLNYKIKENIESNLNIVGFFLSYEKYSDINNFQGILVNYDFYKENADNASLISNFGNFTNYTNREDNKPVYRFYSDEIDLKNLLEIKSSKLLLFPSYFKNGSNIYSEDEHKKITNSIMENKQTADIYYISDVINMFDINTIRYVPAHSFTKNNDYRGSYLEITLVDDTGLSNDRIKEFLRKGCVCKLISNDKSLYKSLNKELIKFTNIVYFNDITINQFADISAGLNGFVTFNKALIYNNDKVILNTGFNVLVNSNYAAYIGSDAFNEAEAKIKNNINKFQFAMQYSFPMIKEIMYETKQFKTLPEIILTRTKPLSDTEAQATFDFASSTIIQPLNSIDLYTLPIASQDHNNPKIYINYINDYVDEFNKRVIRSNPIADESFENSWRIISPEAYKDITENKGNITNLIALGTTLLVHTEHSLFMFDRDNTLQGGDGKTMQLGMPDIFDVDYKEVLASELGSCGLQDSDAWVLDEFGYIFYDNDAHSFYKFGAKKIENINTSITQFIDKYKPYRVRFANDSESNRILVNLLYRYDNNKIGEETLSFNYIINKWISFHSYCFDRAFHTKQMLYLIIDRDTKNDFYDLEGNIYSQMYLINRQNNDVQNEDTIKNLTYNQFDNIRDLNNKEDWYYCNLSIMINDRYELIKTLEYITWKLYKIKNKDITDTRFENKSREEIRVPYSGHQLEIYNDNIYTSAINIEVSTENNKNKSVMNYKKPWWQYDNWNFNYLRDVSHAKNVFAKYMSRLYGNYFIIRIWFGDVSQKCEFETLDCQLTVNPTI